MTFHPEIKSQPKYNCVGYAFSKKGYLAHDKYFPLISREMMEFMCDEVKDQEPVDFVVAYANKGEDRWYIEHMVVVDQENPGMCTFRTLGGEIEHQSVAQAMENFLDVRLYEITKVRINAERAKEYFNIL